MYIYGIIKTLHQYVSVIFHSYMAPHKAKLINTFSVFFFVCLFVSYKKIKQHALLERLWLDYSHHLNCNL